MRKKLTEEEKHWRKRTLNKMWKAKHPGYYDGYWKKHYADTSHKKMLQARGMTESQWIYHQELGTLRKKYRDCLVSMGPGFKFNFENIEMAKDDLQEFNLECQDEINRKGYISIKFMGDFF